MYLQQLFESDELIRYRHWVKPSTSALKEDFDEYKHKEELKWKDRARIIQCRYPLFSDIEEFKKAVASAEVREVDWTFIDKVGGTTTYKDFGTLSGIVSKYNRPRDIKRIRDGLRSDHKIPMPIIVKGKKGSWILSGNTRCNTAMIVGYKPKVIIIDLTESESDVSENNP